MEVSHFEVRYGCSAPPIAEQLDIDANDHEVQSAQIALDGITQSLHMRRMQIDHATAVRQEITDKLLEKFKPGFKVISHDHYTKDGKVIKPRRR